MNIYDIAKQAGVSIATVSRVLNNKGTVSQATRERVEAVLRKHHYTPSAIARGMVSKSLRTVAVLTVDIRVPHYARTAYTMEQEFSRLGYEVILCNTGGNREAALRYLHAVTEKQVDGMVLVGSVFNEIGRDPDVEPLLRLQPVVLANGQLELDNACSVVVDDEAGIGLAVGHLLERGRERLVYFKELDTASARRKRDGFLEIACGQGTVLNIENGQQGIWQLLNAGVEFDAIVCGEDLTAAQAVKALTAAGIRIPQQVAVTGYNNSEYARLCNPGLTTVDNKPEEVATACVQLLEAKMSGQAAPDRLVIRPELRIGEST